MKRKFDSPKDFLDYMKRLLSEPIVTGEGNPKFRKITENEADELKIKNFMNSYSLDQTLDCQPIIDLHVDKILSTLPPKLIKDIRSSIAIGSLSLPEMNACIIKSPENKFAILINHGLMLFLSKYLKLICVLGTPSDILYCDKKHDKSLTSKDILFFLQELVDNYKNFGIPEGVKIKLKESSSKLKYAFLLRISELFIICHELGHFLNGDLDKEDMFSSFMNYSSILKYQENKDHEIELKADITGFKLLIKILSEENDKNRNLVKDCALSLTALFDLLFIISKDYEYSHPNARLRLLNICKNFIGNEFAQIIEKSYEDLDALDEID